jgi:site-specific recombinase XerD
VDVTVPDADREAVAAGVVDADAHASPPAPAALAPPHAAQSSAAPQVLPSERLVRLAELAAAALDPEAVAVSVGPSVLGERALADVLAAVDASTAVNTKRAYRSDWARFTGWAAERGFPPLPAAALVVAHYVTEAAAEQTSVGRWRYTPATLSRWVSSINQFHTAAGLDAPGRAEVVRRALSGVRRIRALPPVRRSPLLLDDLRVLMLHLSTRVTEWPAGVAARRDAALLLMGFAGAYRRSELVGLTVGDVTLHPADGLHVRLRSSKTDQEARGAVKALPYGRDPVTCPPCAYLRWREVLHAFDTAPEGGARRAVMRVLRRQASLETVGGGGEQQPDDGEQVVLHVCRTIRVPEPADPGRVLFPSVHATGAIRDRPMTGHAVNEMIRRRAQAAGFTTAQTALLGGHSLRSGFVTEAFRQGADAHSIMRQTGHRSPVMLEVYAREHAPLTGNAVTRLGL